LTTNKKILQIGHYCATGGISIHIRRLVELLLNDYNVDIIDESRLVDNDGEVFNIRNKQFFKYFKKIVNTDILHVHTTVQLLRLFHVLVGFLFFKKIIVTIHSLSVVKNKKDMFILRFTLFFAKQIIVVSEEIKQKIKIKRAIILPAFLPPIIINEDELPNEVTLLLQKNKDKKLIVSNAYKLNIHKGQDLYGLDLLIYVANLAKKNKDNIKIIFIITTLEVNIELYKKYIKIIDSEELNDYISIFTYPISFVKLIQKSDIVIRATNTDGDALTIREALFLNKPIIASDVVKRPEGTILFKNRDSVDLYNKIIETINKNEFNIKHSNINYLNLYNKIYN